MSSSVGLPPEMLDLVVDHLHDQPATLKACCLVSKSWISRARTHLFSSVNFHARRSPVKLWMETFPDPSNSPAFYTRTLSICNLSIVAATGASARPWIHAFCYLVELGVDASGLDDTEISLVPLHGLSPTLRSLHIFHSITPLSEIFHLICSFHFLEDLTLMSDIDGKPDGWTVPSTSPKFTGTLYLGVKPRDGVLHTVRYLLDLPRGLHFSKISVSYPSEDVESTAGLVSRCFGTLESLHLSFLFLTTSVIPPPLDLSNATKLKTIDVSWSMQTAHWMTETLQTIKPGTLRHITVRLFISPFDLTLQVANRGWRDLDRFLVGLWTSHSILPKVVCEVAAEDDDFEKFAWRVMPELMSRGVVGQVVTP